MKDLYMRFSGVEEEEAAAHTEPHALYIAWVGVVLTSYSHQHPSAPIQVGVFSKKVVWVVTMLKLC